MPQEYKGIFLVGGTRPNFVKISAISRAFEQVGIPYEIIHTGQHYDQNMSQVFFDQLKLKRPAYHFKLNHQGNNLVSIADNMFGLLNQVRPSYVFVVGDVDSTFISSWVSYKLGIPVIHQEAGARCDNWNQTEEVNRRLTDQVSDILFTNTFVDQQNLLQERFNENRVVLVGDVMVDSIKWALEVLSQDPIMKLPFRRHPYLLVTIHRDFNVDHKDRLELILKQLSGLSEYYEIVFPMHPRTKKRIAEFQLESYLNKINVFAPFGYMDFIRVLRDCSSVITDSGGLQTETAIANKICISLIPVTASPHTVQYGGNVLLQDVQKLKEIVLTYYPDRKQWPPEMEKWMDGKASVRIAEYVKNLL